MILCDGLDLALPLLCWRLLVCTWDWLDGIGIITPAPLIIPSTRSSMCSCLCIDIPLLLLGGFSRRKLCWSRDSSCCRGGKNTGICPGTFSKHCGPYVPAVFFTTRSCLDKIESKEVLEFEEEGVLGGRKGEGKWPTAMKDINSYDKIWNTSSDCIMQY